MSEIQTLPAQNPIAQIHELKTHYYGGNGARRASAATTLAEFAHNQEVHTGQVTEAVKEHLPEDTRCFKLDGAHPAVIDVDDLEGHMIDLGAMGLPTAPVQRGREMAPVAVLVHDDSKTLELIAIDSTTIDYSSGPRHARFLFRDFGQAVGNTNSQKPEWVAPGDMEIATAVSTKRDITAISTGQRGGDHRRLLITNTGDDALPMEIIRRAPTLPEAKKARELGAGERPNHTRRNVKRFVGALTAAATAALAFSHSPVSAEQPEGRATSAEQMVDTTPDRQVVNGIPQAETNFALNRSTLQRSHDAFAAYLRGDKNALRQLVEQNGYHANWMDPRKLERVNTAKSPRELQKAFVSAIGLGLDISLEIYEGKAGVDIQAYGNHHEPVGPEDFDTVKKDATSILEFLNSLDKRLLKEADHLDFVLARNIRDAGGIPLNGYYGRSQASTRRTIAINIINNDVPATAAHEWTHAADYSGIGLHGLVDSLNPEGYTYAGDKYAKSGVDYRSKRNVKEPYGNSDAYEMAATTGEDVLGMHPVVYTGRAAYQEKQLALILELESLCPGFTAQQLLNATSEQPSSLQATGLSAESFLANNWNLINKVPLVVVNGVFAAAMAGRRRNQRQSHPRRGSSSSHGGA